MSDVYVEMCRLSPVQKEWKLKPYQLTDDGMVNKDGYRPSQNSKWILSQEDWQEIWLSKFRPEFSLIQTFNDFCHKAGYTTEGYCPLSKTQDLTILWCLFVHKEVYRLVWDWEEKCWCQGIDFIKWGLKEGKGTKLVDWIKEWVKL